MAPTVSFLLSDTVHALRTYLVVWFLFVRTTCTSLLFRLNTIGNVSFLAFVSNWYFS